MRYAEHGSVGAVAAPTARWFVRAIAPCLLLCMTVAAPADPCVAPDDTTGTVSLPPEGCAYLSGDEVHEIIDGLPAGTTIELAPIHLDFICETAGGPHCGQPGGPLGGEQEFFLSNLDLTVDGTGDLAGFHREIVLPVFCMTATGPRTTGDAVQTFPNEMVQLQGELFGDPDFCTLRVTGGSAFGMPSPGQTTLTRLGPPGSDFQVDSFFDIEYQIEFQGCPGSILDGKAGTTQRTVRMEAGALPSDCEPTADGSACEPDTCVDATQQCAPRCVNFDLATGRALVVDCECRGQGECQVDLGTGGADRGAPAGGPCVVPDDAGGTVTLPPQGCEYLSPDEVHEIVDGLPAGTTIELAPIHRDFICQKGGAICGAPIPPGECEAPGGSLGGDVDCFESVLALQVNGTGDLGGFTRSLFVPVFCEAHTGPRTAGDAVQTFPNDMFRLQGELFGDPDFCTFRVSGGTDFGLPSPGETTLVQLPTGDFTVDSFFDIEYQIEFQGCPGSVLEGMGGVTTRTIRMQAGVPLPGCLGDCPPGTECHRSLTPGTDGTVDVCCDCIPVVLEEACCFSDGTCADMPAADCDAAGGIPQGPGTDCSTVDCTPDQFCPLGTDYCQSVYTRDCLSDNPAAEACFPKEVRISAAGPVVVESCACFGQGGCGAVTITPMGSPPFDYTLSCQGQCPGAGADCQIFLDGVATGQGSIDASQVAAGRVVTCDCPTPPQPEACCFPSGGCANMLPAACVAAGGTPQGPGTDCTTVTCPVLECGPTPDGSGCLPTTCEEANDICQAKCMKFDPLTGQTLVTACECSGVDECHVEEPGAPSGDCFDGTFGPRVGPGCVVADTGGTVVLPPPGCPYLSPDDVHEIIDGLPPGTTIELGAMHSDFFLRSAGPGGSLGGQAEVFDSFLSLTVCGTGELGSFTRTLSIPIQCETHTGPRTPGDPVQSFDTDMFRLQGGIGGDPDFAQLIITGGTDFGMPSPGHTTLTQLPSGNFAVDSFFDIEYRIDFQGAVGGALEGLSGSTTATIRMATGSVPSCVGGCPPGEVCVETQVVNPDGTIDICCSCAPEPTEACCFSDGSCADMLPADCLANGGTPQGPGSDCSTVTCPPQECGPTDDGSGCLPAPCPIPGDECQAKCINFDPATGQTLVTECECSGADECHIEAPGAPAGECIDGGFGPRVGPGCEVTPTGGTVVLPPPGCAYLSPDDVHEITDGLPPGTTIELGAAHEEFILRSAGPGGTLGGEVEQFDSFLQLELCGTGDLGSFTRFVTVPVLCETHTGPRTPGDPVQSFATDMFRLQGGIFGDPDFDQLVVIGGTDFGMPSPGHTVLTQLPSGNFVVDSFFDIEYQIDFQGAPGSALEGLSGSTTAVIRMATGSVPACVGGCPPGEICERTTTVLADGTLDICCTCIPEPLEACCFSDGSCADLTAADCIAAGGAPQGPGTICLGDGDGDGVDDACPPPQQLCPLASPFCEDLQSTDCELDDLTSESCWPKEVLVSADGQIVVESCDCFGQGGCGAVTITPLPPAGYNLSCQGVCPDATVPCRIHIDGMPTGQTAVDSSLVPAGSIVTCDCPPTQACCFPDGGCADMIPSSCVASGGIPQGPGTDCTTVTCPVLECGPKPDGTGCLPVACPDTNQECVPSCVDFDPATGQTTVLECECRFVDECQVGFTSGGAPGARGGTDPCVVPDDAGGTVTLPPQGCEYLSPDEVHMIIDGLPPDTTIEFAPIHRDFICHEDPTGGAGCSQPLPPGICEEEGGSLGGNLDCFQSTLAVTLNGTGELAGFSRNLLIPIACEVHTGPRTPGEPVQSFDSEMFRLQGGIFGDPDFDQLFITGGTDFGLPSPGHTTLTQLPSGNFSVDSFFDIDYRIDFVGAPGGALDGMSGSTTGSIRMETGVSVPSCIGGCLPGTTCVASASITPDGTLELCCDCEPLIQIVTVDSCVSHVGVEHCLGLGDGTVKGDNVEPRLARIGKLVIGLDGPAPSPPVVTVDCGAGPIGGVSASSSGTDVTVLISPSLPNLTCCEVSIDGVSGSWSVISNEGDVNQSGVVNSIDFSAIKARFGQPTTATNFQYDLNGSGIINSIDSSAVKARFGATYPSCP